MVVENTESLRNKLINKQFEMIGEKDIKFEDFPKDGIIKRDTKKKYWYEWYWFKDKEQYLEWRDWARKVLTDILLFPDQVEKELNYLDLRYGLNYKISG